MSNLSLDINKPGAVFFWTFISKFNKATRHPRTSANRTSPPSWPAFLSSVKARPEHLFFLQFEKLHFNLSYCFFSLVFLQKLQLVRPFIEEAGFSKDIPLISSHPLHSSGCSARMCWIIFLMFGPFWRHQIPRLYSASMTFLQLQEETIGPPST